MKRNPWKITRDHLKYYFQKVTLPVYDDEDTDRIDLGQGRSWEVPELSYETKILRPDHDFEYMDREWEPKDMFMSQNDELTELGPKHTQANVDRLKAGARNISKPEFSLQEVKLVKPTY